MNQSLFDYILQLADDSTILGQRLGEWCGHAPAMELDMAITNVSLDLFGQSRSLYQYAAEVQGEGKSEDDLAFLRDDQEYRNCLIVELPNGDFGKTIMRQYLFDEYQLGLYEKLTDSADEQLAAIAQKSLKETIYHRRLSREWVKRLGDGTEESHRRIQNGLNELWSYTGSMFVETEADKALRISGITFDMAPIKARWDQEISQTLSEATLIKPEGTWMHEGGRGSVHTEHLGTMLAEMQVLQRSYPGLEW